MTLFVARTDSGALVIAVGFRSIFCTTSEVFIECSVWLDVGGSISSTPFWVKHTKSIGKDRGDSVLLPALPLVGVKIPDFKVLELCGLLHHPEKYKGVSIDGHTI